MSQGFSFRNGQNWNITFVIQLIHFKIIRCTLGLGEIKQRRNCSNSKWLQLPCCIEFCKSKNIHLVLDESIMTTTGQLQPPEVGAVSALFNLIKTQNASNYFKLCQLNYESDIHSSYGNFRKRIPTT